MVSGKLQRYFRHGTLVQLRVFEAVVRHRSFTHAGEEMHLAQPTVSVLIRKLTETVGVPLLEHIGKRVQLTAAGEKVYAACAPLVQTFSELDDALADMRGLKSGSLRIATTTPGKYLLPQILAAFVRQHPGIKVSVHVGSRQSVLGRLAENADDLYLLGTPPDGNSVVAFPILPNPLVAFARPDHALAHEAKIPFQRFARETLLVREPGSGTRLALERVLAEHGMVSAASIELGSNEAIKEAMIAGLGVSVLYRYALGFELDPQQLIILDVQGLPRDGAWHFVHRAGRELPLVAETFVTFAREQARRIFDERVACKGRG